MSLEMVKEAVNALNDKKGNDIKVIDIRDVSQIGDYFVICTGTSSTHVKALADEVEYRLGGHEADVGFHKEGYGSGTWVLLDYKDIVVHVMYGETRDFYNLEHLWADGKEVDLKALLEE